MSDKQSNLTDKEMEDLHGIVHGQIKRLYQIGESAK